MDDQKISKRIKRTETMSYIAIGLMLFPILGFVREFQKVADSEGLLIALFAGVLEWLINPIFIAGVVLLIISAIKFRTLKRGGQATKRYRYPTIILIATLVVGLCTASYLYLVIKANKSTESSMSLSVDDKIAIFEIMEKIVRDPDSYSKKDHDKLWAIVGDGPANIQEYVKSKDITLLGFDNTRMFWEDVLVSLKLGRPYISLERKKLEKHLENIGSIKTLSEDNEKKMRELVLNRTLIFDSQELVVDEELVRAVLTGMDENEGKIKKAIDNLMTP